MSGESVQWLPAIVALAIGAVAGVALVINNLRDRRSLAAAGDAGLALRDLEGERDALIAQIRELEDGASKRTAEQLAAERFSLELRAARVLRDLDRTAREVRRTEIHIEPSAAPAAGGRRGFVLGMVIAGVIGAVVWLAMSSSTAREGAMGASGGADVARLEQQLAADPNNDDLRLELARAYLGQQKLMEVYNLTQQVLIRRPNDPRALTYGSMVRLAMGQGVEAQQMLETALQQDPQLLDAWVHLAFVFNAAGQTDQANAALNEALRRHPDQKAAIEAIRGQLGG